MKFGVLGGIGYQATVSFLDKLGARLRASGTIHENSDYPAIDVRFVPAPELFGRRVDLRMYRAALDSLDREELDFIVMVCNTVHLHHRRLQARMNTELLNLPDLVRAHTGHVECMSVLGTSATIGQGLYRFEGIRHIDPTPDEQRELDRSVEAYLISGQTRPSAAIIAERCRERGAETLLLACTEISLMLANQPSPTLDTMDVLVSAVAERCLGRQKLSAASA